jgi:superfamily II DNA or RNA helicase
MSENIYPSAWNTKWTTIKSIKKGKKQRVYDIEVEDTHCFFANNTMVHNCHHASSRTVKEVLEASPYAYWKYGGTATPVREDGADIMLQALFGAKIVDISASYLIKRGDLVKPYIFMEPIDSKVNLHSYQKIYEACIVKNEKFNKHVAETVNYLVDKKLSVLVLVQQYKQGEYLKTLIPNSEFITGKISSEKRKQYLNDLRQGKITLIGTSLADEGIDIRGLDAVVMAGGGKSVTRISQRIGRCLRKDKKAVKQKDRAIVIIYEHNAKYLDKHAKKVRSILRKEPEFEVISSNGADFIYDEIDRVLGIDSNRKNVFKD